jgi:DNA polymerase elongation subunit (family B)
MTLVFDIETGPQPDERLLQLFAESYQPLAAPLPFDQSAVKLGNTKNAEKIAEKIAAAKLASETEHANYADNEAKRREAAWLEFKERAALDAVTGCVLAVGVSNGDEDGVIYGDEFEILSETWALFNNHRKSKIIGFNSNSFDLPFLIRRSWINGIDVPSWVRPERYFDRCFVDLREVWLLGQRWGECPSSLDAVCSAMGLPGKLDGVTGADFAKMWLSGDESQKQQALEYLGRDIEITAAVAKRFGVVGI